MIAIPNMDKPESCWDCVRHFDFECSGDIRDCPIIEINDDLIRMLKESAIVIKTVYDRLKKTVSESDELKKELIGKNADLIIIDEANAIQDVESVGE